MQAIGVGPVRIVIPMVRNMSQQLRVGATVRVPWGLEADLKGKIIEVRGATLPLTCASSCYSKGTTTPNRLSCCSPHQT
jgi:hypothetical protein